MRVRRVFPLGDRRSALVAFPRSPGRTVWTRRDLPGDRDSLFSLCCTDLFACLSAGGPFSPETFIPTRRINAVGGSRSVNNRCAAAKISSSLEVGAASVLCRCGVVKSLKRMRTVTVDARRPS